jgi:hypothetical protein
MHGSSASPRHCICSSQPEPVVLQLSVHTLHAFLWHHICGLVHDVLKCARCALYAGMAAQWCQQFMRSVSCPVCGVQRLTSVHACPIIQSKGEILSPEPNTYMFANMFVPAIAPHATHHSSANCTSFLWSSQQHNACSIHASSMHVSNTPSKRVGS